MNFIDNLLNRITMYRLMLYYLTGVLGTALILSMTGVLNYEPWDIIYTAGVLIGACWASNKIFSKAFGVPANVESDYITAFILALIITPTSNPADLPFLILAAVLSQASKYIFAYKGKHIFNPAAIAVVATAFALQQSASWWVGTFYMLPIVLLGGFFITRKIQRSDLVITFLLVALATMVMTSLSTTKPEVIVRIALLDTPLFFFALVMLTEPLTTPPSRWLRVAYAALVGLLFAPSIHIGPIYSTPELVLLVGNIFSFIVSPKGKFLLTLKSKSKIAKGVFAFVFQPNRKIDFQPGQYLEWTVDPNLADSRGNRRYFTIASSPTEKEILLGVKYYDRPSTFKKYLMGLSIGDKVSAGSLAGEFRLPKDPLKKLVFIAGGIGITPYRSMLKYLIDNKENRSIKLFYSVGEADEFAFREIFTQAQSLGVETYLQADRITTGLIRKEVPDFKDRIFYLSGPHSMVVDFEIILKSMGVPGRQIKIDFFPGLV